MHALARGSSQVQRVSDDSIRQHTYVYVIIREIREHTSHQRWRAAAARCSVSATIAYVSIRTYTSSYVRYVSIRRTSVGARQRPGAVYQRRQAACLDLSGIRQHTCVYCRHTSAYVRILQQCISDDSVRAWTSQAYVSIRAYTAGIRQHTSAYVVTCCICTSRQAPPAVFIRSASAMIRLGRPRPCSSPERSIRTYTSAYVRIRQHTSAHGRMRPRPCSSPERSIRTNTYTSAYVSIRIRMLTEH